MKIAKAMTGVVRIGLGVKKVKNIYARGVRKGDIVVCSQRGEGILGFTTLTGDGKDDPIVSGTYNTLPISSSREAFALDPILPIPKLKEAGCSPRAFMSGRMGTVFPLDKEEFRGIIDAIIKYSPEMGEDIINWLERQGFEHQCEVPKPEGSVDLKIVKSEQTVASIPGEMPTIDNCILELFFLNQVGLSDGYFSPMEVRYFHKCIPPTMFDGVIEKWNEIEEIWQTMSDEEFMKYYEEGCQKAKAKEETWKAKVINNMVHMAKSDRRVYQEELSKIAEIAKKIGAKEECRKQLLKEFDWDSYRESNTKSSSELQDVKNRIDPQKKSISTEFMNGVLEKPAEIVANANKFQIPFQQEKLKEDIKHIGISVISRNTELENPPALDLEVFRLPQEIDIYKKMLGHPGLKQWKRFEKKAFEANQQVETGLSYMDILNRRGGKITKSSKSEIPEIVEDTLRMFGFTEKPFSVFTINHLIMDEDISEIINNMTENASVSIEDGSPVFVFIRDILSTMNQNERRFIIGHEVGHYLLGHNDPSQLPPPELLSPEVIKEALDEGSLKSREEMYELYYYNQILSQIRELSADRIGLMVAKNLQGTITGLIKLSCGRQGEIIDVDDFIKQGEELKLNPEDIRETHPFQPKRSWALKLFHESDLYYKALGKEGGEPISKFNSMLPKIVPIMDDEETKQTSLAKEVPSLIVEEYVTEIFFHTLVALSDGKETSAELWTISNFIPQKIQVEVKAKWDELNAKIDSESEEYFDKVFDQLCSEASGKESKWKKRLIKNMIKVSKANRRVCEEELYKIIEIAEKIDAQKECSREFLKEFAYDPFAQEE